MFSGSFKKVLDTPLERSVRDQEEGGREANHSEGKVQGQLQEGSSLQLASPSEVNIDQAEGSPALSGGQVEDKHNHIVQWACSQCTYLNLNRSSSCEMCTTPKPPDTAATASAALPLPDTAVTASAALPLPTAPPAMTSPKGGLGHDHYLQSLQGVSPFLPRRNYMLYQSQHLHQRHRNSEQLGYPQPAQVPAQVAERQAAEQHLHQRHKNNDQPASAQRHKNNGKLGYPELAQDVPLPPEGDYRLMQGAKIVSRGQITNSLTARAVHVLCDQRIIGAAWSSKSVVIVLFYLFINVLCIFAANSPVLGGQGLPLSEIDYARAWGSLAVGNTAILVVPATRNSLLTWLLGLPFDQVVMYHRFLGRFCLLCVLLHACWFFRRLLRYYLTPTYYWGFFASLCGLVLFLTSLDIVRRRAFNLFFFSHYVFVGYITFAYLHVPQTAPFLSVAVGLYLLDQVLRVLRTSCPRRTLEFTPLGHPADMVRVRFSKASISSALGLHKAGQYYFINFPALSLTEWHPFSVSSNPRESTIEIHIRALGDHTRRIVQLATEKKTGIPGKSVWIRADGPYGYHDVQYNRYPLLVLVGGGVGVTPVVGLLKAIYGVGKDLPPNEARRPRFHCNEAVYMVWVMQKAHEYEIFRDVISECQSKAQTHSYMPPLHVIACASRENPTRSLRPPLSPGRPDFGKLFKMLDKDHKNKAGLLFACGPDAMVMDLWGRALKRSRHSLMEFHHEVFNF
eukprot:g44266.t1